MISCFPKAKVLAELSQIKKSIGDVQKNQDNLMKKMKKVESEFKNYIFDMDKCYYAVGVKMHNIIKNYVTDSLVQLLLMHNRIDSSLSCPK